MGGQTSGLQSPHYNGSQGLRILQDTVNVIPFLETMDRLYVTVRLRHHVCQRGAEQSG
jgi:hypothetical protein